MLTHTCALISVRFAYPLAWHLWQVFVLRIRPVARIEMQRAKIANRSILRTSTPLTLSACPMPNTLAIKYMKRGGEGGLAIAAVATVVVIATHFGFVLCSVSWGNEQEAATHRHRQTPTDTQAKTHTLRLATSVYLSLCLSIFHIFSPLPLPLLCACVEFALCCIFALICSSCFQDALN